MGLLTLIKKQKVKDKQIRVLTLGLDNSGKTTIIKQALGEDVQEIAPTMGLQINSLTYKQYTLNIWDIGGQISLRSFWSNYFDKTDVVMWVIDAISLERLEESFEELRSKVVLQDRLVGIHLIIVVNKIDLIDESQQDQVKVQVCNKLNLLHIPDDKWTIKLVSAMTGAGLTEMLDWIVSNPY
jgi:ADP-ribosylation factor-like protein 2